MKFAPYSFSKIEVFKKCPKLFFYKYIEKLKEPDNNQALKKGREIHEHLEKYNEKTQENQIVNEFINSDLGTKYLPYINNTLKSFKETAVAFDKDFKKVDYWNKNAIFRGKIDLMFLNDNVLYLNDYKTGKYKEEKYQNYDQLIYYAIYFFKNYSKLEKIHISFIYVEHNIENALLLERKYLNTYVDNLLNSIDKIENETEFACSKSKLCDFCAFKHLCFKEFQI